MWRVGRGWGRDERKREGVENWKGVGQGGESVEVVEEGGGLEGRGRGERMEGEEEGRGWRERKRGEDGGRGRGERMEGEEEGRGWRVRKRGEDGGLEGGEAGVCGERGINILSTMQISTCGEVFQVCAGVGCCVICC